MDPDRRGHQEFKGPQLALFREQPHGQDGQNNHEDDPHAREQISEDQIVQVDLGHSPLLHLHQLDGLRPGETNVEVGEQPEDEQKDRADHIDNGGDEVTAQFFGDDGLHRCHNRLRLCLFG